MRLLTFDLAHQLPIDARRIDPDLDALNEAWAELPETIRDAIVGMVRATAKGKRRRAR